MSSRQEHARAAARLGPCPDEHALGALIDAGLSPATDPALAAHVADCEDCRRLIGGLGRLGDQAPPDVPESLMAQATRLGQRATPASTRWWQAAAAAACVILAVGVWRGTSIERDAATGGNPSELPAAVRDTAGADDVRGARALAPPRLIEPPADSAVGPGPIVFRWTPVTGALQYRVQLLTSDGDVVWSATTAETSSRCDQSLDRGRQYYVWVAAQMPEGRRLQSAIVGVTGAAR